MILTLIKYETCFRTELLPLVLSLPVTFVAFVKMLTPFSVEYDCLLHSKNGNYLIVKFSKVYFRAIYIFIDALPKGFRSNLEGTLCCLFDVFGKVFAWILLSGNGSADCE